MLSKYKYILKSFFHYLKANLLVAAGVAISTTVLTGSLIIGDSVRYSLEQTTFFRLGETTHLATAKERYFRQELAREISFDNPSIKATPMLLLEGVAVARGGQQRANRVQVAGVENTFDFIAKDTIYAGLNANEIYISRNLSERLNVAEGDNILVRIRKASLIPLNAPFVSAEETSVSMRDIIKKILTKEELGRFSLKNSQTAPYNIFLSIQRLNDIMELEGKANNLLIYSDLGNNEIRNSVNNCLTPADAGLEVNYIEATEEVEISTHRIFMDQKVSEILFQLPESKPLITYFVNGIGIIREDHVLNRLSDKRIHAVSDPEAEENYKEVPYSFVSSLNMNYLNDGEIILTQWAADDLNAIPGDSVRLKYFEIGPLRKLAEKESWFILKDIVPMNEKWADSTLMPWLPGLSDAGHCREWDAGVPINMDAIRDTDEDYWNEWKGAPKAYISLNEAHKLWKNRFGVYTAFRYPVKSFDKKAFNNAFDRNITHEDIGMAVEPLREQGLQAARNGTDFSMLFLGLSFFILAASVILTALLFRLNLETRSSEIGILTALGFRNRQIGWIFILEGFVIALSGAFLGLILSILYTYGVFKILNTLWF